MKLSSVVLLAALALGTTLCTAVDDPSPDSSLYLKVQLAHPVKMAKLKPGDVVEGSLARDVYSSDRKLFPAGSAVRLTVDHLEKRRRTGDDHWPLLVKIFTPRHENSPAFKKATIALDQQESTLPVSLISVGRTRQVHPQIKKAKSKPQSADEHGAVEVSHSNATKLATPIMVLEASGVRDSTGTDEIRAESTMLQPETLPAGTQCKILLLDDVSASKSKPGDTVRARLLEPVFINSKLVLPAGSLFQGKVVKNTHPRWLSRAGSLYLIFNGLTVPNGSRLPIAASLAGADLEASSHTRMDAEGRLQGERPGKAWMAINLGVSAGIAKEVDDGAQLVIEAIVSSATDASTAGTSRIVASCISGLYMVTRRGRDVVLPRFTEMDIAFDRAVLVNAASLNHASQIPPLGSGMGGK